MGRSTSKGRRRAIATLAVAVVAAATIPSANSSISEASAAPPTDRLNWSRCYQDVTADTGAIYECSKLKVPLDHDTKQGGRIQLALVRLPATDPSSKIGSVLLNPGGPGGSGVDFALFFGPFAGEAWGPRVREQFDLVGFDPRGVARSTGVRCFGTERQAVRALPPVSFPFPLTAREEARHIGADRLLANRCDRRGNKIIEHMSTANVARDMDLLREAVGDEQLTYVGGSYGSYLGVTYANLFPDRVRALAIDGILDPVAWANVEGDIPFSTRLRSDQGAQATLDRLFEECESAAPGNCALAPNPGARFDALAQQLLDEPVMIIDPFTGEEILMTYQLLVGFTLNTLSDPFAFAEWAELLAGLEQLTSSSNADASPARLEHAAEFVNKRGFPNYENFVESFPAVACADTTNPRGHEAWSVAGAEADERFGYFGRIWTWSSSPCAVWPFTDEDRYVGPFDADTTNPVLVIGNLQDPSTRYEGAQTVRNLLPNSGLLTVDVAGHTSLGISFCAGSITGDYLLDPSVAHAVDGTTCPAEFNPFDIVAGGPASAEAIGLDPALRARLLSQMGVYGP